MSSMSKFEFENVFNCGWGMLIVTETPDRLNIPDKQVIGRII
jgi:phosphoribosylaminoimidazole (AIR) synthetase